MNLHSVLDYICKESSVLNYIGTSEILEAVIFFAYILICITMFKRRFSLRTTVISFGAAAAVIMGVQVLLAVFGGETLVLTMLPLTAYLPFSVILYFLSDCGVFETAAACSIGMLGVLILKMLQKILHSIISGEFFKGIGNVLYATANAIIVLAAAGLVLIAYKYIGRAFRFCVIENQQNRLLLSVPVILIFLMIFYFLNSTTDEIILLFTMLIAVSVFLIVARLLVAGAELIRAKRSEKKMADHMELQRRGYDRLVRKMEAGREYRHNMRHHLRIIEGLARQGECDKIIEYTDRMNGSLGELENVDYCKNPEINAVLTEYIGRAKNIGCRVAHKILFTEKMPFAEDDVCMVLANSLENAVNACAKLPEEERYINISAEYVNDRRLFVSVENPCADALEFDENGLPVIDERLQEHGLGLRSVNRIAEKYNGFLRCKLEKGEFVFHAVLFGGESVSVKKGVRTESISKRAVISLCGLVLGTVLVLNILPSAAEAASSLFSVNLSTIKSFVFSWGDNLISVDSPEFDGNGADELNNTVKSYTDEAKEKFLWYFNRRYNGYVAEEMRYTVIQDDEKYFIAQFAVTINAGGSMNYSRWIVYDKALGKVLELADLFKEGSDYIGVLSAEISQQIIYKNENMGGQFYTTGDHAFTEIKEDANFYIDSFGRIVIVFDEYEIAPGFMGSPQFFIQNQVIEDIVR